MKQKTSKEKLLHKNAKRTISLSKSLGLNKMEVAFRCEASMTQTVMKK